MDRGVGQSDVQQNMSDHADKGISKKEENKREGVSESAIMMQSECSEMCERGRFNKFCLALNNLALNNLALNNLSTK